jgi:hypothetical protein
MKIVINENQLNKLCEELSKEEIDQRASEANLYPSDAQKEAGNYKMGHVRVRGFDITIENPVGSKRYYGKDKKKYNVMQNHYGYFTKSKGKDGDQVDVFIGPDVERFEKVYVVDQKMNGKFDESKVMFGFSSKKEAKAAYFSNFDKNWHGFMHITGVSLTTFKKWLYRGRKQRQPFADYVEIQKKKLNEERERELRDIMGDLSWEPVRKGSKMNLMNKETGEYLSPEWFNWCGYMYDGISVVRNDDGKYNYLKDNGELLLDDWYDDCEEFKGDKGRVMHDEVSDGEYHVFANYVDRDGNFLGDWKLAR